MAKNKAKVSNQKKDQTLISEEERNSNPILNAIYKRIRNLNKKLSNIDELKTIDEAALKPQQRSKLASRGQVENQIKKIGQFVVFYKGIVDEIGGSSQTQDNSQSLIKIATLIAVGQNIDKFMNLGEDKELHDTHHSRYKIISNTEHEKQLVDRIADIFGVLTQFLKNPSQYRALQDYITYMPKQTVNISQQKKQQNRNTQPNLQQKIQQNNTNQPAQQNNEGIKNVKQANEQKLQAPIKKQQKQVIPDQQIKKQSVKEIKEIKVEQPPKQSQVIEEKRKQQKKENNPEQPKNEQKAVEATQQKNKNNGHQNRGYNNAYRKPYSGYRSNNHDRGNNGNNYKNSYRDENGYYNKNRDNKDYTTKNNGHKYYENKGNKQAARKDSDTSLQPTPQKNKANRPKYIQKD